MIVVDSNVVAYLLLKGFRTASSEAILQRDPIWAGPILLNSEIRNVLTLYMRKNGLALETAQDLMDSVGEIFEDRFFDIPSDPVLSQTDSSPLSAYDAEFVVLARVLDIPLVTWDKQILKTAKDVAVSPADFLR